MTRRWDKNVLFFQRFKSILEVSEFFTRFPALIEDKEKRDIVNFGDYKAWQTAFKTK
jgi:hypothetical protein